jgi:glycosyltransferase involved in cell wall biosynthesis
LVVYTGTLGHVNGVSYLVELAAAVEKDRPDICFLVIGEGNEEDQVRALAAARGVLDKNFFMMKPVAKRAIPSILSAADLAISLVIDRPVLWTNSANKFFDALAAGTPIAINHEGWQADLIRETGAGLVLSARDIHMAAVRLTSFLLDQDRLGRAGGAAKQLASERFARDQLARLLEEELRRAVESREALGRATES